MQACRALLCLAVSAVSLVAFADDQHHHDAYDPNHLGTVSFPTSCLPKVQKDFDRGVALLHSFWYEEAEKAFRTVAKEDKKCSMSYWGIAMSRWHQLWDPPSKQDIQTAQQALDQAIDNPAKTERERGFVDATRAYYWRKEEVSPEQRAEAYSDAMEKLHEKFPDDKEVTIFYALSLLAAAPPGDRNVEIRKRAGALLQPVFDANPQHPGVAHYLIHSYDNPELAELGLPAARAYAKVAPSSPHALHMPSHIFSRVGMWQESIDSNLASIAATQHSAAMHMGGADHQMHAMDFLQYAYLQSGQEKKAAELMAELDKLHAEDAEEMAFTQATMAVRYTLETRDWKNAAAVEVPAKVRPWLEGMVRAARAEGAARSGNVEQAEREVARLKQMETNERQKNTEHSAFIAEILTIDREEGEAWLKHARGQDDGAIAELKVAADAAEKTGGEGIQAPLHEVLADLLLEVKRPADALREYETALKLAPNRFDGLYGAARAAEESGKSALAQKYYSTLLKNAATSERPEIAEARAAISKMAAGGK
jgi:tetratricopeptide (TPR) repeat protein